VYKLLYTFFNLPTIFICQRCPELSPLRIRWSLFSSSPLTHCRIIMLAILVDSSLLCAAPPSNCCETIVWRGSLGPWRVLRDVPSAGIHVALLNVRLFLSRFLLQAAYFNCTQNLSAKLGRRLRSTNPLFATVVRATVVNSIAWHTMEFVLESNCYY
jgi:hypothetical protein